MRAPAAGAVFWALVTAYFAITCGILGLWWAAIMLAIIAGILLAAAWAPPWAPPCPDCDIEALIRATREDIPDHVPAEWTGEQ